MKNFSVLTWNVQGRKLLADTPFTNIMPFLETTPAEIVCLQEIPDAHRKLSLLKYFGQYHMVISHLNLAHPLKEHNHTVILSKYPVLAHGEVNFPPLIKNKPLERASWADLLINDKKLRIYNCHLGVLRMGIPERQQQLAAILRHAAKAGTRPVIICGDMNTCIPPKGPARQIIKKFHRIPEHSFYHQGKYYNRDERHVFARAALAAGFADITDPVQTTWCIPKIKLEIFKLKLDWFFIKNLQAQKLTYGPYISDHRPLFAQCLIQ